MPQPTDENAPQPTPETPPAKPRRRGMLGSAKSMVVSMVAVLAGCVVWLWAVPQSTPEPEAIDNVPSIAREVSKQQKWDVALPDGLAESWVPINVRLVRIDQQPPTWHAGYQTPDKDFVSAEQTRSGDEGWVRNQTQGGEPAGASTVDGVKWTRYEAGDVQSLVRSTRLGGLQTIVTGKVDWSVLEQFASTLEPLSES